jgi:hypothetical protein
MTGKCNSCGFDELKETDLNCPDCQLPIICCSVCNENLFTVDPSGLEICPQCMSESINRAGSFDEDFID